MLSKLPFTRLDGATWSDDDTLYLAPSTGAIHRLAALGGDAVSFIEPDPDNEGDFHTPHALPGDRGLLYVVHRNVGIDTIEVFAEGNRKVVLRLEGESADRDPRSSRCANQRKTTRAP